MKMKAFFEEMLKSRHIVYYFVVGFGLIFLFYGLITPRTYRSEGKVLPQMDLGGMVDISGLMGGLGGQESRMMRIARAAGLSLGYSSADIIAALLDSRSVQEAVITECDIFSAYKIKKTRVEDALKQLEALTQVEITKEDIVKIMCIGKTPELSANLVNSYINNLDLFLREKSMSKGKNMRMFVEKRLLDAETELKTAADSIKVYQERTRVIVPDEELKAAIEAYASLKGQLFAKEVQTEIAGQYSYRNAPYYIESRAEAEALKKKLSELEAKGIIEDGFGVGFGVAFGDIPSVMQEYLRRYLQLKIQEEVYAFLKQQYEQARILEIKDTPVITVLDWGKIPERKHSPKLSVLLIVGLAIGFAVRCVRAGWVVISAELFKKKERRQLLGESKDALMSDIRGLIALITGRKK